MYMICLYELYVNNGKEDEINVADFSTLKEAQYFLKTKYDIKTSIANLSKNMKNEGTINKITTVPVLTIKFGTGSNRTITEGIVEGNKIKYDYDQDAMFLEGIISTISFPNLKDAELQDAYNSYTPQELLENMLYPDELEKLGRDVAIEIGAAENPFDLLDEAKN